MGLQNAVVTRISNARVRTTHVSGTSTDIGIELAIQFDVLRRKTSPKEAPLYIERLNLHCYTLVAFLLGGVAGIWLFQLLGYTFLRAFGTVLLSLSLSAIFRNFLPWLTTYDNVALAVRQVFKGQMSKSEMHDWIVHNLELVQMGHAGDKHPAEISGGMKQRVGIARALAMKPKVLLMDEPFGALDALTRAHLQDAVMEIQGRLRTTILLITHDVDEAVLLSDRVMMMTNGPAARVGEVLAVELARPRSRGELANNPLFHKYRRQVLQFLHEKHQVVA